MKQRFYQMEVMSGEPFRMRAPFPAYRPTLAGAFGRRFGIKMTSNDERWKFRIKGMNHVLTDREDGWRLRLYVLFWTLLFSPAAASAADLFSFQYHGKIFAFAVSSSDPVVATVKDNTAANLAINWALRFYDVRDANIDGVELRTKPTRFYLVRLAANAGTVRETLYAVILPDGSIVEPTVRD